MNELEETAEERLQKKALVNARLLLDKLEKERRTPILLPALVAIIVVAGVAIAASFFHKAMQYREPEKATSRMTPREYASYFGDRLAHRVNTSRYSRLAAFPGALQLEVKVDQYGRTAVRVEQSTRSSQTDESLKALIIVNEPFGSPPRQPGGAPFVMHVKLTVPKESLVVEAVPAQP